MTTDDIAPTVSSTTPADDATNVLVGSDLAVTFSEAVTASGIWATLICGVTPITALTLTDGGDSDPATYVINPDADLPYSTNCTATILKDQIADQDLPADKMADNHTWSFDTASSDALPTVSGTTPVDSATNVSLVDDLTVTFSEAVTVTDDWYSISCVTSSAHTASVTGDSTTFIINPEPDFAFNEQCTVTLDGSKIVDQDGSTNDPMGGTFSWSFTTTSCGAAFTPIYTIQGSGSASPIAGSTVVTEGIVTGDLQNINEMSGFFIQSLSSAADADPATSEGIFVYGFNTAVVSGDRVRVSGTVVEYTALNSSTGSPGRHGMLTELSTTTTTVCNSGNLLPDPVEINLPLSGDPSFNLEPYEGMLVTFPQTLTVQQNYFQGRFGQVTLGAGGRIANMHNFAKNGGSLYEYTRMIILDDSRHYQNLNPISYYAADGVLRSGDTVKDVTGILDQGHVNSDYKTADITYGWPDIYYRLQPTVAPVFSQLNLRPAAPPAVGGRIKVASANVLNYFTTLDKTPFPSGAPYTTYPDTPRGADSDSEFTRQQDKIVAELAGLNADVFGLMEIESWDSAAAPQALVTALNAYLAAHGSTDTYAAVADPTTGGFDPNTTGGDDIQVALIYKTSTVTPVGASLSTNDTIFSRSPFAQEFTEISSSEQFVVVVNHFKSKGCDGATGLDADQGDGQGCWNQKRREQAAALLSFINTSLVSLDPDVFVIGDLNSYGAEDPIADLVAGGLVNQVAAFVPEAERYSYVFDGTAGYLDHGLGTLSTTPQISGVAFWHVNADEPLIIDYNLEFKGGTNSPDLYQPHQYKASDHDPVLIGLNLSPLTTIWVNDDWAALPNGTLVSAGGGVHIIGYDAFVTLQAGIAAAPAGGTVNVLDGTYNEELEIGKSITILGPNADISPNTGTRVAEAVIAPLDQVGVADTAILTTAGNIAVTIKGLTFDMVNTTDENDRFVESINKTGITWVFENNIFTNAPSAINGNWYITGTTAPSSFTLLDNYFYHSKDSNGISLWGDGHTIDIRDNVWKDNGGWAVNFNNVTGTFSGNQVLDTEENGPEWYDEQAGFLFASANDLDLNNNLMDGLPNPYIRIYPNFSGPLTLTGNTFSNSEDPLMGVIRISDGADLTQFAVEKNKFLNDPLIFQNMDSESFDGSPNWFGSAAGPAAGTIDGSVTFTPWCAQPECTSFLPTGSGYYEIPGGTSGVDVQAILNNAPAGSTIKFMGSTGSLSGGYVINTPHLTIILADGTVIQNNSPCFVINADYTTIKAETIGGAQCVPTSSSNGIDVTGTRLNITITGIEFVGATGTDGIHFAGGITDTVIIDNFIHNFPGAGLFFAAQPAGVIDIHGNLFKNNTGNGIEAGAFTVPAEYNSWGHIDGAAAGDGASTGVDAEPWTHVDLYMTSSGSPWPNQVVTGQTITYTVYGNLENTFGADVSLVYPANLTLIPASLTNLGTFNSLASFDTTVPNTIQFYGLGTAYAAQSGTAMPIFSAQFTAATAGAALPMNLDETSDGFAMNPGYGSSTNIYADALLGNTVTIIDLPTLASTDLPGYYLTSDPQEFHVTLTNPADGGSFTNVLLNFRITNALTTDLSLEYYETMSSTWLPLPLTQDGADLVGSYGPALGFPIIPGYTATSAFRVTAATAKNYPVTITLNDLVSTPVNAELARLEQTAVVYAKPVITSADLVGPYLVGIAQDFTLNITDPSGIPEPFELVFTFPAGTSIVYDGVTYTCAATCPPIPVTLAAASNDLTFNVTFPAAFSGDVTVTLFDSDWTPTHRPLASLTQTGVVAYANFTVTGTFSMQGRGTRAGIPVTLTSTPYTYNGTSIEAITSNVNFVNVAATTYTITTNQPRYLDVIASLNITKVIDALNTTISELMLRGGDADDNNHVYLGDASIIGAQYGYIGIIHNGDVNFSGKVDIFDLAMVGGNYTLTSAQAYAGVDGLFPAWVP